MRLIVAIVAAAVIGASVFHVYYRSLEPTARCRWDHPLDGGARQACVARGAGGYDRDARRRLDELIGTVSR